MPKDSNINLSDLVEALTIAMTNANKNNQSNVNSEETLSAIVQINRKTEERLNAQRAYANKVATEMSKGINSEWVTIPKIYKEYQPKFTISINGCTICLKADGRPNYIHSDYAVILRRRMKALDDKIELMNQGAFDNAELPRY